VHLSNRGSFTAAHLRDLKQIDVFGVFKDVSMLKVQQQLCLWAMESEERGYGVQRTNGGYFGLSVKDVNRWLRFSVEVYEEKMKSLGVVDAPLEAAHFKLSLDARLHFDKGSKATEIVLEFLNDTGEGLGSMISLAKWVGPDNSLDIAMHACSEFDYVMAQLKRISATGIDMGAGRAKMPMIGFETYDYPAACAVVSGDGSISVFGNDFDFLSDEVKQNTVGCLERGDVHTTYTSASEESMQSVAEKFYLPLEVLKVSV
jgi:hypothetical protein